MRYRVFAALVLPRENQERLGEVLASLQAATPPGTVRWVRPDAVHLTLKFYGDVPEADLPALEAGLAEAASSGRPMRLSMVGLGVFPNPRRPQVIWAGLAGELEVLQALQSAVEAHATALGFAPEGRAYQPHLTLGRVRGALAPADHMRLLDQLKARAADWFGDFEAAALSLVRSDLRPAGSIYTTLYAAPLGSARVPSEEQC